MWVDLDPARAGEVNKVRPAIIVSNDGANRAVARLQRGTVTVVPLTSNVSRVYPFQVLVPAEGSPLPRDSKAQTEQIRAVAYSRVGDRIGRLHGALMSELEVALRLQLVL